MSARTVAFMGAAIHLHPELMPLLAEHLDDQQGELLPHLLLADVTRWIRKNSANNHTQTLLGWLESEFAKGDSEIQELVSVSFLELLPQPWEDASAALAAESLLGPTLQRELKILRS